MNRRRIRTTALALVTGLLLAGCSAAASPSPSAEPSVVPSIPSSTVEPTTASPSQTPTPEPTASPTPEPTATPQPPTGGGFTITSHPEADALFLERDECQNLQDGYQLVFPEEWYTNTEIRDVPACSWFSPGFYTVAGDELPEEIAIEIFWRDGAYGHLEEPMSRDEGMIASQSASRIETGGTSDDPDSDGMMYEYVVQLGPPDQAGPTLVARTDTDMGGDYELNKAVLDRIMATMEFVGSIQ